MRIIFLLILFSPRLIWSQSSQFIHHVQIMDGTGKAAYDGSLRIVGNRIVGIGKIKPERGDRLIDGKGLTLAPGFIDSHSHHLQDVLENPHAISTANQGVTTIVVGQDGESFPMRQLKSMLRKQAVAVNVATYTGQSSLREQVMGEKNLLRAASQQEIDQMKQLLKEDLKEGSLGLSTGLEYESAFYSTRDEVLQLAAVVAAFKGRYISHIRSEDITMSDALDEIIDIGRKTKIPVQISHIKLAKKSDWGKAQSIIELLEKAREEGIQITADIYPYTFWHSTPRILFPKRDYRNIESAEFATQHLFDPAQSYLVKYAPNADYKGKTFEQIAKMRNETTPQTLMAIVRLAEEFRANHPDYKETVEAMTGKSMADQDLVDFIAWQHSNICSDGNAGAHPRGYGSFTRILGKYVREDKVLSLENAIFKMTGLTAKHLGIKDRGTLSIGKKADLVLFNPTTVQDHATIKDSHALSDGIEIVWVNGQIVYQEKKSTGLRSGVLIKRTNE
ncbi:MAG: hypothetical protein RJA76_1039 [Bacteroidota bacterium]